MRVFVRKPSNAIDLHDFGKAFVPLQPVSHFVGSIDLQRHAGNDPLSCFGQSNPRTTATTPELRQTLSDSALGMIATLRPNQRHDKMTSATHLRAGNAESEFVFAPFKK